MVLYTLSNVFNVVGFCFLFVSLPLACLFQFARFFAYRLNSIRVQNDFLKQIPRMAEITVPTNYLDWKSKQLNLPTDVGINKNVNLSGRREGPLYAEEPNYVLLRTDELHPRHMGK